MGRDELLKRLDTQLQGNERIGITGVRGMGGIGKTELALQYAIASYNTQTYPGGVCWFQARNQEIATQIVSFARVNLGIKPPEDLDTDEQVRFSWQRWPQGDSLIVLDDVIDYDAIAPYLPPPDPRFKVLITTRINLGSSVTQIEIEELSNESAIALLKSIVGDERIETQIADAFELCSWVGNLPLGLELLGRFLAKKDDWVIVKLLKRLEEQRLDAKALIEGESGMTASLGVAAALELSWAELAEQEQDLACLLGMFAIAPIPWNLVEQCIADIYVDELEDWRDEGLRYRSLLKRIGEGTYQVHQIVREFFREKLKQKGDDAITIKTIFGRVMVAQAKILADMPILEHIELVREAIAHLEEIANSWIVSLEEEDMIWPYLCIVRFYKGQGNYGLAELWGIKCLNSIQKVLGNDHPDVIYILNHLAGLYNYQGRYEEAEPLYLQALEIGKKVLGNDHPDVASNLNNLALLCNNQGRYEEAEPLFLQALELRKKLLGDDHPDVATSLNNLASLYNYQGRYEEAEPLFLEALELGKRVLGNNHPLVAHSLNNLALLYQHQERYEEAESLFLQALESYRKVLDNNHPYVATTLNNMASLYNNQGRYEEAEPLFLQTLGCYKQALGGDHPYVATALSSLALLYEHQGRYEEAEPLFLQSLELRKKMLGNDHPDVAASYFNLGGFYQLQKEPQKAKSLYLYALDIYKQKLGNNHPNTQSLLSYLYALPIGIAPLPLEDLGL